MQYLVAINQGTVCGHGAQRGASSAEGGDDPGDSRHHRGHGALLRQRVEAGSLRNGAQQDADRANPRPYDTVNGVSRENPELALHALRKTRIPGSGNDNDDLLVRGPAHNAGDPVSTWLLSDTRRRHLARTESFSPLFPGSGYRRETNRSAWCG